MKFKDFRKTEVSESVDSLPEQVKAEIQSYVQRETGAYEIHLLCRSPRRLDKCRIC